MPTSLPYRKTLDAAKTAKPESRWRRKHSDVVVKVISHEPPNMIWIQAEGTKLPHKMAIQPFALQYCPIDPIEATTSPRPSGSSGERKGNSRIARARMALSDDTWYRLTDGKPFNVDSNDGKNTIWIRPPSSKPETAIALELKTFARDFSDEKPSRNQKRNGTAKKSPKKIKGKVTSTVESRDGVVVTIAFPLKSKAGIARALDLLDRSVTIQVR
jgi:hypothetical protein